VSLFSSWGSINCFTVSFVVTWLHNLTSMHNVLVPKLQREQGRVPSPNFLKRKAQTKKINNQTLLCAPSWCTGELSGSRSWSWVIVKGIVTHLMLYVDMTYIPLKISFSHSFIQIKSSSTWVLPASLCEGPFFYFNVESPSSCFMHQLREHSCHS
jgi:hypothetical protein